MRIIYQYVKPHLHRMALGLLIKFTGSIMDLLLPWILAFTIDSVIPTKSVFHIVLWGGLMLVCSGLALVTNITANRMASRVARDATRTLRHDLFEKVSYLSCRQVDAFSVPSLEARLTTDTYNIHQMLGMMQRLGVRAPILLIGGILVTFTLEPALSLIMILLLPVIALPVYLISKKSIPLFGALQRAVDSLVRTVRENITGIRVIKALSKTDYEKQRFSVVNAGVVEKEKRAQTTMAVTNPLMNLILNLGLVLVIIIGAYRVNAGLTQPGKIIAFLTYFTIILNALLAITRFFVMYSKASASAQRIRQVLETPQDLPVAEPDRRDSEFHIEFAHVSFSYHADTGGQCSLADISFSLRRGEKLGIIGPTGSGKSTIIRLLLRLYDPTSGTIRINGEDIRGLRAKDLHTKFGVVFQNDVLFADTVRANIDFGRGLDDERLKTAAAQAQAAEFLDSLPDGLGHRLATKSANLSGGQKQRLLIARALAGRPEILILDDSSSALDYKTDALLRQALSSDFGGTTTVIVAQRISSVMNADRILVLEDGRAAGFGTHDFLMKTCESYAEIYRSQMGGRLRA